MATTITLPTSGVLLGRLIDAFDLRRWDANNVLSPKNRTTTRFFAGERVGADAERAAFCATGAALIDSGVLPEVLLLGAPFPPEARVLLAEVPLGEIAGLMLERIANHWDEFAGALRRLSAPVSSERLALVICLQLVGVDLALRLTALLWLTRSTIEGTPSLPWLAKGGMNRWLRELHRRSGVSRDQLASDARVSDKTLDAWLDDDLVRPTDENLQDLANALAACDVGAASELLRDLRRAYGLRAVHRMVVDAVGQTRAAEVSARVVGYAMVMLALPRVSRKPVEENDLKMHLVLTLGSIGRERLDLGFIDSMLNAVWRNEEDPVWRTTLRAARRSWFEHMREAAAKLAPGDEERFVQVLGWRPSPEQREALLYSVLASKEEQARDPRMRAAMDAVAAEGGYHGALERKIRASELSNRGDPLGAIRLYREALVYNPLDAEVHFRLGANLWEIGDVEAGLAELEIAVQLDPGWDRAQVEVAIVLLNQGRNADAARRLEAAREVVREPSPWLLLHLGCALERLDEIERAVAAYEELLTLKEDHAEALDRLAHLRLVRGEKRRGAELAKQAAHLGFTDVFDAWASGYYDRRSVAARPPRTTPSDLIQLGDNTWLRPGSEN
jgi:tetratricopeptide (TPR) repeat protein